MTNPSTETVTTHDLNNGDVVRYYGAELRLRDRKEHPEHIGAPVSNGVVITFETDLLNNPGGDFPLSYRCKDGKHH